MKRIIMILAAGLSLSVFAQATEVIVSQRTVKLPVDISTTKVKFSRAGYSSPVVKVLVPALAAVTLLDHRNVGEGAPCLASYEANAPSDVIQNNPSIEEVEFQITLTKTVEPDADKKVCNVSLTETIDAKIRNFAFVHQRFLTIGTRDLVDCK